MIKIIDATLSLLDDYNLTREKIYNFIELIGYIGVKDLQISNKVYEICKKDLPRDFQYYMEVDTSAYMTHKFPSQDENIWRFFVPKQKNTEKEIPTYHINDMEEPFRVNEEYKNSLIKIVGLDNLILNDVTVGLAALNKKVNIKQLILCPEDTYKCATAIGVLFLQNKGYAVVSSILGIGNKASTEQIILSLHVLERYMVNKSFVDLSEIRNWMEDVLNKKISSMTPVLGREIFYVESGVHVDGILKKPTNYEPYAPDLVGLRREVILGKHSGKTSVYYKMDDLRPGSIAKLYIEEILEEVKSKSRVSGQSVTDADFIKIIEGYEQDEKNT